MNRFIHKQLRELGRGKCERVRFTENKIGTTRVRFCNLRPTVDAPQLMIKALEVMQESGMDYTIPNREGGTIDHPCVDFSFTAW